MRVIIDGDACPVIKLVEDFLRKKDIPLIIVKNYNHNIYSDIAEVITVGVEREAADFRISSIVKEGDVVISQDYGLFAMIIVQGAIGINQFGKIINKDNIDFLLNKRDFNKRMRKKHNHYTKFKKRSSKEDKEFIENFKKIISKK